MLGRTARRGQLQPPGAQLRHRGRLRGRLVDRLRGHHAGRQLVELPRAQARREHADRVGARGDLLLRDRRAGCPRRLASASATTGSTARPTVPIEVLEEVRSGDVVLVPHGYHGPSVAAPGYHMYYLNVMAGPGAERAWKIVDDPEHAWLRGTWDDQAVDPRLPLHAPKEHDRGLHRTEAGREDRRTPSRPCDSPSRRPPFGSSATSTSNTTACAPSSSRAPSASSATATWPASARRCCRTRSTPRGGHRARRCGTCSAATSRPWCTAPWPTPRQKDRLQTWAVTASVGPGSTNMLTGAALATINRLPVLLLPADTFATRVSSPVLQELELPSSGDVTVNDAFKPLSRFFDRVWRPEAAAVRAARRDARAHRPRRDGRGDGCASRRTCRPRRTTGRNRCSPNAPGTSPGRCRSAR